MVIQNKRKIIMLRFKIAVILLILFGITMEAQEINLRQKGEIANEGFVFIDGRYIESPYRVTVNNGWLEINNIRIKKLCEWPIVTESPEKPVVTQEMFKKAKNFADIPGMYRWIMRNIKGIETQHKALKNFYESFLFVERATFPSKGRMNIMLKNGKTIKYGLEGVPPIITKEQKLKSLERNKKRLAERLNKGDTYFFFKSGIELTFGKTKTAKNLKLIVEILESNRPDKEKINLLQRMVILPESASSAGEMLIRNFKSSEQLTERIDKFLEKQKIHPKTLKDIPKLLPSERLKIYKEAVKKQKEFKQKNEKNFKSKQN